MTEKEHWHRFIEDLDSILDRAPYLDNYHTANSDTLTAFYKYVTLVKNIASYTIFVAETRMRKIK